MGIVKRIKEHGIRKSVDIILKYRVAPIINKAIYYISWIAPINKKLIVMESEGDLSDNAYALYDYMRNNGYLERYKVVWLVDDLIKAKEYGRNNCFENTEFVIKVPTNIQPKRSFYLATCKWYIYDHCNLYDSLQKRREFTIIYITHGCGYKSPTVNKSYRNNADEVYYTGKHFLHSMKVFCCCDECVMFDIGYPRNDYLLGNVCNRQELFAEKYHFKEYKKIALWMPTFRRSKRKDLSEEYFDSITGLPVLETEEDLKRFDKLLKAENILCIIKVHHLQAEIPAFISPFSNIILLKDEMLQVDGIQLYQMVRLTDFLITDYSSIGNDYMLMDKPIIYILDDYEDYIKSRGFSIDDPAQYFIGEHVVNIDELFDAVIRAGNGEDRYKEARNNLLPSIHTYQDAFSSKRIVQRIGFK